MIEAALYPVNLRLAGQPCLVVGGGRVACQKVLGLLEVSAAITVVAPEVDATLAELPGVTVHRRPYERGEVAGYRFVISATNDPAVNQQVYDDGEAAGVLVNSADDPERCRATLPARLRRGPLLLTVSTAGRSPAVASYVKRRLDALIGPEYEALVEVVSSVRQQLIAAGVRTEGLAWQEAIDSGMLELVREGYLTEAKERLQACLSSSSA